MRVIFRIYKIVYLIQFTHIYIYSIFIHMHGSSSSDHRCHWLQSTSDRQLRASYTFYWLDLRHGTTTKYTYMRWISVSVPLISWLQCDLFSFTKIIIHLSKWFELKIVRILLHYRSCWHDLLVNLCTRWLYI